MGLGVNLPARRVLVMGVRRGSDPVHPMDIIQMVGRAGRTGLDERGDAYVLLPVDGYEGNVYLYSKTPLVKSQLESAALLFHSVAEVDIGTVWNPESLVEWHARSLAAQQGRALTWEQATEVFNLLEKCHAIRKSFEIEGHWQATGLGKVCSWLYLDPRNVFRWAMNFSRVNQENLWDDDLAVSYALGSIPEGTLPYVPRDVSAQVEDYYWKVKPVWNDPKNTSKLGWVESWCYWLALTGVEAPAIVSAISRTIKSDVERTMTAMRLIDKMWGKWEREGFWNALELRIKYGVPAEMAFLVMIPGIGAVRAKKLWGIGIRSTEDLLAAGHPVLQATLGASLAGKVIEHVQKEKREHADKAHKSKRLDKRV